jgi:hypothetical protein
MLDAHARVLGRQSVQAFESFCSSPRFLGRIARPSMPGGKARIQGESVFVVRVVQHGIEVDLVDLWAPRR